MFSIGINRLTYTEQKSSLVDSENRINRFNSAQKKVSALWEGQSKRASYNAIKKCVMSELELREGNFDCWYDNF